MPPRPSDAPCIENTIENRLRKRFWGKDWVQRHKWLNDIRTYHFVVFPLIIEQLSSDECLFGQKGPKEPERVIALGGTKPHKPKRWRSKVISRMEAKLKRELRRVCHRCLV